MSVKKYRFVSPGVFINEIDNSQLPASPAGIGPVVIGRARSGPGLRPVTLNSFSEFISVFGNPVPGGGGENSDIWRDGNTVGPTYGPYAAQAYLRNSSPLTYVRLLGAESSDKTITGDAGWTVDSANNSNGAGVYGLFVFNTGSCNPCCNQATGSIVFDGPGPASSSLPIGTDFFAITSSTGYRSEFSPGPGFGAVLPPHPGPGLITFASGTNNTDSAAGFHDAVGQPGVEVVGFASDIPGAADTVMLRMHECSAAGNNALIKVETANHLSASVSGFTGGRDDSSQVFGALAATFYVVSSSNGPNLALTGTLAGTSNAVTGTCGLIESIGDYEYKLIVKNYDGTNNLVTAFNFNENSSKYIRKVFNTNPQLTNAQTTQDELFYWLGESYERHLKTVVGASSGDTTYAALLPMVGNGAATGNNAGNLEYPLISAQTPWIFSQDISTNAGTYNPANMPNLFRFHAMDEPGAWTSRNLKISIESIKASTNDSTDYGTFTVKVRKLDDSDNVVRVVEQFNDCNLNPNSLNYVGRKIGDRVSTWNDNERRYQEDGQYINQSKYIRIEMDSTVDLGGPPDAQMLPFGSRGIVKYADVFFSDNSGPRSTYIGRTGSAFDVVDLGGATDGTYLVHGKTGSLSASIRFPAPAMRISASDGGIGNFTDAYFGFAVGRSPSSLRFERSNIDLLRALGGIGAANQFNTGADGCEASTVFTLDDISGSGTNNAVWVSGSRVAGASLTAQGTWQSVLDDGFDRFTIPIHSGFDGLDILEPEPFNNTDLDNNPSEFGNYAFYSVKRAVDSIADPEVVEMNLATVPGITQPGLTTHLMNTCEDRGDSLAVVDLEGGYVPTTENTDSFADRRGSVTRTVSDLRDRGVNTSYACAYYPWVQMRDSITGQILWAPPSIAALGVFSSSQRKTEVWFAPAGFNRGGLTVGAAGVPIINVVERLTRKMRDDLYEANVNPIAKFPAEGLVIFGQKTLQVTPSALDRINVRRLLIFLKKRISQIASQILFEPNVRKTWDRFTGQVNPFLEEVKTNFGLSDYKLVLDDSTTTADLIDRNILYAKIFLKPTRAIEYIALDFNITRTGASFVD